MTSTTQRAELQAKIWKIANDVRGAVDGWDFKQFVLGALFYRFISENFTNYIEGGDDSIDYAKFSDDKMGYLRDKQQFHKSLAKWSKQNKKLEDLRNV